MVHTPYNLLVDIGNTFVKWGRYRAAARGPAADNCLDAGHALLAEIPELASTCVRSTRRTAWSSPTSPARARARR